MKTRDLTNDQLVDIFLGWQHHLLIRDNRVQLDPITWTDLQTIIRLCELVEAIADRRRTDPTAPALQELACITAALLTTAWVVADDNAQIVAAWRTALKTYRTLAA